MKKWRKPLSTCRLSRGNLNSFTMKKILILGISILLAGINLTALAAPPLPTTLDLVQRLIRIDTTNPPGQEIQAAIEIQKILAIYQIDSEIFESAPGRGNLVARLKGTGQKEPLLLLGHLDVVPADPKEWTHPPFAGEIAEDYLYGRGAMDMKGMVTMEIQTLLRLKTEGFPLAGDVILLLTADEEAGGKLGAQFMTEQHWDKIAAKYVMSEGSIGFNRQGLHLYPVQVAEKGVAWMELTSHGTSGHGSMPTADNAVIKLLEGLHRLTAHPQPIQRTAIVEDFLQHFSEHLPFPNSFFLSHLFDWPISWLAPWLAESRLESEKVLNAMLRNTVVPTVLKAGNKVNVIPGEARAQIDVRILPGETPENFQKKVEERLKGLDIQVTPLTQSLPSESPFNTVFFAGLKKAILTQDPEAVIVPYLSPGATDNRFFRAKGVISYGLIPMLLEMKDLEGLHGKDERIPVKELARGEKILYQLVADLQGMEKP